MQYTVEVSDGDNDYIIPHHLKQRFDELMEQWEKTRPYSDEWYEAAEVIGNEFSEYQR